MIKAKRKNAMSETVNIRELALDILLNVTKQGEYSHIAEKQVLEKYQYLNKKDRFSYAAYGRNIGKLNSD